MFWNSLVSLVRIQNNCVFAKLDEIFFETQLLVTFPPVCNRTDSTLLSDENPTNALVAFFEL